MLQDTDDVKVQPPLGNRLTNCQSQQGNQMQKSRMHDVEKREKSWKQSKIRAYWLEESMLKMLRPLPPIDFWRGWGGEGVGGCQLGDARLTRVPSEKCSPGELEGWATEPSPRRFPSHPTKLITSITSIASPASFPITKIVNSSKPPKGWTKRRSAAQCRQPRLSGRCASSFVPALPAHFLN